MVTWKTEELGELIKVKFGESVSEQSKLFINSIAWKIDVANYHRTEAKNAFNGLFDRNEIDIEAVFRQIFTDEKREELNKAILVCESNIVAAAYALHSIPEIIVQLIAIVLNLGINVHDIKINKVLEKIIDSKLKNEIQSLIKRDDFIYLSDFVNTTKHIRLVSPIFQSEILGRYQGVIFKDFKYKKNEYHSKRDIDFLDELSDISYSILNIGSMLNDSIR